MDRRERLWSGGPAPEEPTEPQVELRPLPKLYAPPPETEEEQPRRSRTPLIVLVGAVAGAAIVVALFLIIGHNHGPSALKAAQGQLAPTHVGQIYAKASPGVVSVAVQEGQAQSTGTGFVIDRQGTIVTNAHVVGGAGTAQVRFGDQGRTLDAPVLGTDPSSDLAVLRVDPSLTGRLHPLALADSSNVHIRDEAVAIGDPFGL